MQRKPRIVVLWDLQNTPCKKRNYPIAALLNYLKKCGSIEYAAVFHEFKNRDDWEKFEDAGFCPILASTRKKNNADYVITNHANNLLHNPNLTIVAFVTSDGDFIPLVKDLQNAGKKVWVIHKNELSQKLRLAADRCIPWSEITGAILLALYRPSHPLGNKLNVSRRNSNLLL